MNYVQQVTYRKLPSGRKHYTEEVTASTPVAAKRLIQTNLGGTEIEVIKCVTSYSN
tara:strand:+ start:498 stop:665 length:168 start_codon:yes stop_codon:yes gene_type:complete